MDANLASQIKLDSVDVVYYRTEFVPAFFKSFYKTYSYREFNMAERGGYFSESDLYYKNDVPHEQLIFHAFVNHKEYYLIYYKSGPLKKNVCMIIRTDSYRNKTKYITLSFDSDIDMFGSFKLAVQNNSYKVISIPKK